MTPITKRPASQQRKMDQTKHKTRRQPVEILPCLNCKVSGSSTQMSREILICSVGRFSQAQSQPAENEAWEEVEAKAKTMANAEIEEEAKTGAGANAEIEVEEEAKAEPAT